MGGMLKGKTSMLYISFYARLFVTMDTLLPSTLTKAEPIKKSSKLTTKGPLRRLESEGVNTLIIG
jgi:hypothetical protein